MKTALNQIAVLYALLVVTLLLMAPEAGAANTTPKALGEFRSGVAESRCLDVTNAGTADGTNVKTWYCTGNTAQKWILTMDGEVRSGLRPNYCLDIASYNQVYDGANVHAWSCHGGLNQKWELTRDGELKSAMGNYCLDVSGANTQAGANVQMYHCNKTKAQRWSMAIIPWAPIQSAYDEGYCLSLGGALGPTVDNVEGKTCSENDNGQKWYLDQKGNLFNAAKPNLCLVYSWGFDSSIVDPQYPFSGFYLNATAAKCGGVTQPMWDLTANNQLRMRGSGSCISFVNSNSGNVGNARLVDCDGSREQQWTLKSRLEFELRQVEGMAALAVRSGDSGYLTTDPVTIVELLDTMNASAAKQSAIETFSAEQYAYASEYFQTTDPAAWAVISETAGIPRSVPAHAFKIVNGVVMIMDTCDGENTLPENNLPFGEVYAECDTDSSGVAGAVGIKLAEWGEQDGPRANIIADETAASFKFTPAEKGSFDIGAGYTAASVSGEIGDEDGSYAGVSVGAGLGADGALKWGEDDQYGFRLGIKLVTIEAYVSGEDVNTAVDWTKGAANDVGNWLSQAAKDTASWVSTAADDTAQWVSGAVSDIGDAANETGDFFGDLADTLFGWL